jgi:hypothetical protein
MLMATPANLFKASTRLHPARYFFAGNAAYSAGSEEGRLVCLVVRRIASLMAKEIGVE